MSAGHLLKPQIITDEGSLVFRNIYIYGLGMMGGSLAHTLKRKNLQKNICI